MVSDAQILKTQTCFFQEMVQKERIQPGTFDFTLLVPFCLYLVDTLGYNKMGTPKTLKIQEKYGGTRKDYRWF